MTQLQKLQYHRLHKRYFGHPYYQYICAITPGSVFIARDIQYDYGDTEWGCYGYRHVGEIGKISKIDTIESVREL